MLKNSSSFRDNSGIVFEENHTIYRKINFSYKENYEFLINSGLFSNLVNKGLLIPHEEISSFENRDYYKIIKPLQLNFISYPSSWSFSMIKDAALLTLEIQKECIKFGMILKDASIYNIQFLNGNPILIDSLSFQKIKAYEPWGAYGQFCRHFLTALSLLSYCDLNLYKLFSVYIDGIPLDLASKLLPYKAKFNVNLFLNLFLHNRLLEKKSKNKTKINFKKFTYKDLVNQVENLIDTIEGLSIKTKQTEWMDYYDNDVKEYYLDDKKKIMQNILNSIKSKVILDIGSNDGTFSFLASGLFEHVLAFDVDPLVIERFYLKNKKEGYFNITPLIIDIANPEPGIGWLNDERTSILQRTNVDTIMALALIHHLRITNGIPLKMIADFFSKKCTNLVIEFIPKTDPKVVFLLQNREDIFNDYEQSSFIEEFSYFFKIESSYVVHSTERVIFLMKSIIL